MQLSVTLPVDLIYFYIALGVENAFLIPQQDESQDGVCHYIEKL